MMPVAVALRLRWQVAIIRTARAARCIAASVNFGCMCTLASLASWAPRWSVVATGNERGGGMTGAVRSTLLLLSTPSYMLDEGLVWRRLWCECVAQSSQANTATQ